MKALGLAARATIIAASLFGGPHERHPHQVARPHPARRQPCPGTHPRARPAAGRREDPPGAAGGPKALGIQGLDLALFGDWLPRAPQERSLIGASIGSWRFASACLPDAAKGISRLGELYTAQRFPKGVTMAEVSRLCAQMLDHLLEGQDAHVLSNPHYRLNVVVVKSHGLLAHDRRGALGLGLGSVIGSNLLGRPRLARHFERVILHDSRLAPPLAALEDFPRAAWPWTPATSATPCWPPVPSPW